MKQYETPIYKIVLADGPFEVRSYQAFYIVQYENKEDASASKGFMTLFKYIDKNNADNEKISMTIPVIEELESQHLVMSFVIPQKYWESIPQPKDSALHIKSFEEGYYAVIHYSGNATRQIEKRKMEELRSWIENKNFVMESNFKFAYYNSPMVPGPFRRNEILVKIVEFDLAVK